MTLALAMPLCVAQAPETQLILAIHDAEVTSLMRRCYAAETKSFAEARNSGASPLDRHVAPAAVIRQIRARHLAVIGSIVQQLTDDVASEVRNCVRRAWQSLSEAGSAEGTSPASRGASGHC